MVEEVQQKEQKDSIIVIKFAEIGSVMMDVQFVNVTPMQILALSEYLKVYGQQGLMQDQIRQAQQEKEKKIVVPSLDKNWRPE